MSTPTEITPSFVSRLKGHMGGTDLDYPLSPITVVTGPSGSGKSRLIHMLSLVLTESAPDIMGRPLVKADHLIGEFAGVDGYLEASAHFTRGTLDGENASYSKATGKKPRHSIPRSLFDHPWRLPVRWLADVLTKEPNAAKTLLLPHIVGKVDPAWINGDLYVGPTPTDSTTLSGVIEALKGKLKVMEAGVPGLSAAQPEGLAPSEEQLVHARSVLATAQAAYNEAQRGVVAYADLTNKLAQVDGELATLVSGIGVLQPRVTAGNNASALPTVDLARLDKVRDLLSTATNNCPCCGTPVNVALLRATLDTVANNYTHQRETAQAVTALTALVTQYKALTAQRQELVLALSVPVVSPDAALANVQAAHTYLDGLTRAAGAWDAYNKAQAAVLSVQVQINSTKVALGHLEDVRDRMLSSGRTAFENRVQAYMPDGLIFGLSLDPFRLGLKRPDGSIWLTLSGGQRACVLLATALAIIDNLPYASRSPYTLFALDEERNMDGKLLGSFLRKLVKLPIPGQILIANMESPIRCPNGVTVIEVGAGVVTEPVSIGTEPVSSVTEPVSTVAETVPPTVPEAAPTVTVTEAAPTVPEAVPAKKRPGRPKGSKNKPKLDPALVTPVVSVTTPEPTPVVSPVLSSLDHDDGNDDGSNSNYGDDNYGDDNDNDDEAERRAYNETTLANVRELAETLDSSDSGDQLTDPTGDQLTDAETAEAKARALQLATGLLNGLFGSDE
jgi:energy-coupling factor transporter ATP-binding protein EcfA2